MANTISLLLYLIIFCLWMIFPKAAPIFICAAWSVGYNKYAIAGWFGKHEPKGPKIEISGDDLKIIYDRSSRK